MKYTLAGPGDHADIERLLAQTDMQSWVRLSFRADLSAPPMHPGAETAHAFARDGATLAACASRTTMPTPHGPVTWIGGLRVAPAYRGRPGLMRKGLTAIRALLLPDSPGWQIAAILSENTAATRLLTSNLPGFPRFTPVGDLTTLALRPRRAKTPGIRPATEADLPQIRATLSARTGPLLPLIPPDFPSGFPGLTPQDFLISDTGGTIALWDQRPNRAFRVTGYAPALATLRPLWNLAAPLTGQPALPPPGTTLAQAFLAFLRADTTDDAHRLVLAALDLAHRRGLATATLGLPPGDPLTRRLRHRAYRSTLYRVTWPDAPPANLPDLAHATVELALL